MLFAALGDSAVVVTLGDAIDDTVLARVRELGAVLTNARIPGITDIVPAYTSVTVFYDPVRFATDGARPYPTVCQFISWCAAQVSEDPVRHGHASSPREVRIPVCYGGDFGVDFERVLAHTGLSREALIAAHAGGQYRVQAIGFAPGFPYLAGLAPSLAVPRLDVPRIRVPAGSVGIGGDQTGIYPAESPGGWNLIGRSPMRLFDPEATPVSVLKTGDSVVFYPISSEEFATWK